MRSRPIHPVVALLVVAVPALSVPPALAFDVPEAVYPEIPVQAKAVGGFVPRGWVVESTSRGDLNKDGVPDLLLVLRQADPGNVVANDPASPGTEGLDTNPRILVVAFARSAGGFTRILANHDFIPRHDSPTLDDPFASAAIVKGTLRVGLHFWANAGSWSTSDSTFTFRYQDGAFRLIGYDDVSSARNTGKTQIVSINFLTRKARIEHRDDSGDETRIHWDTVPPAELPSLDQLGCGADYAPEVRERWWSKLNAAE